MLFGQFQEVQIRLSRVLTAVMTRVLELSDA